MTTPDVFRDAEYIADVSGIPYEGVADLAGRRSATDGRFKKVQSAAKVAFIDRLLRDLDVLIYCQLSALYYMDCSIVLFAIRAIVQLIFFTPKAPPFDPTRNQPFIGAIFISNAFCMIHHKFFGQAEAGEATRGYLHGGLLIDFIGQKAPVSVTRLLLSDLLVLVLDLVMLGLVVERVKTTEASAPVSTISGVIETPNEQDHDSEERGVLNNTSNRPTSDGIELDELRPRVECTDITPDEQLEHTELLADPSESGHVSSARNSHALDTFSSGEAVIMDLGFFGIIRDQWRYSPAVARRTSPYVPSDQTSTFLRQRFGLQVNSEGRLERVAT
ncbi:DSC4 family protein [Aspergillus alliaceus]|uniref:DSC4 family protein n=1 Tax=Petromyces alliaceus TaxID=209559 RepID=UPI0012A5FFC4|nr:uncharacterized protein BDW43DRAFT_195216 [Aspergillus alliaceus]KAB8229217.1 hypothetical protein BDW43DRAFT_195216 [Aspergillus alliaceus]